MKNREAVWWNPIVPLENVMKRDFNVQMEQEKTH